MSAAEILATNVLIAAPAMTPGAIGPWPSANGAQAGEQGVESAFAETLAALMGVTQPQIQAAPSAPAPSSEDSAPETLPASPALTAFVVPAPMATTPAMAAETAQAPETPENPAAPTEAPDTLIAEPPPAPGVRLDVPNAAAPASASPRLHETAAPAPQAQALAVPTPATQTLAPEAAPGPEAAPAPQTAVALAAPPPAPHRDPAPLRTEAKSEGRRALRAEGLWPTAPAQTPADVQAAEAQPELALDLAPRDEADRALALPEPEPAAQPVQPRTEVRAETPAPLAAASTAHAPLAAASPVSTQLSAHTIERLAARIVEGHEGRMSRFDVALDPAGLGSVEVRIEINARGELAARMTADNPQAAAELRGRAPELRQALEQAGFDLSRGGLSFDLQDGSGGRRHEARDDQPRASASLFARAFDDAQDRAEAAPPTLRRAYRAGVDVRI